MTELTGDILSGRECLSLGHEVQDYSLAGWGKEYALKKAYEVLNHKKEKIKEQTLSIKVTKNEIETLEEIIDKLKKHTTKEVNDGSST